MLTHAVEAEVHAWVEAHAHITDAGGRRQVVRNGRLPRREILTGLGPMEVNQPRVHDRRPPEEGQRFRSKILPPYLRKASSVEELIPWLYLKGISTGDMGEALQALLGPDVSGLSASTVVRLKSAWESEHAAWSKRSLADRRYVYVWADGVHFNIRLEDEGNDRQCILVLMGATAEGQKELIAIADGYRESKQSWKELLSECVGRGMDKPPKVAVGDGALGFWAAVREVWPAVGQQRCWVHKTANVLCKMPKHLHPKAKAMLHDIWMAATRQAANKAFDLFIESFRGKYPKACECLSKDRDVLLTFYDYPAEHWGHLRTTNPIESVFATVRLRHNKTKGSGSRTACLTMVWKLMESASKHWRALNGSTLLNDVIAGTIYIDGERKAAA
jgi:transposase-like protein